MRILTCLVVLSIAAGAVSAQQWQAQTSGTGNLLNGVWFVDALRGFAVGGGGTFLETGDGGQSWAPIALTADDLLDVAFHGPSLGLVVGDNGTIFRTVDGGQSWTDVSGATGSNLTGVAFGAGTLAYAAGRDGVILRSANDGATWTQMETGADRYRSVAAVGQRAWVVGNGGVIRATDDGGLTWFSLASGTPDDLHDVSFVSPEEGWIAGQSNTLLYTGDGGQTWSLRNSSIGVGINAVFFGNPSLGWSAGGTGNAYASTDGAVSWNAEPTPTLEDLNALHFADVFHGWAVGGGGAILTRQVPSVTLSVDKNRLEWDALAGDVFYDVVGGDLSALLDSGGDFATATDGCIADEITTAFVDEFSEPAQEEGLWFLVRVNTGGGLGTYDSGSFRQAGLRDEEIALSGADCP